MPTNLGTVAPKEEVQYQYTSILSDDLMVQKPDVDPVREGYAFKFWAKSDVVEEQTDFFADGAVKYDGSATTLYAVWEEKPQNAIAKINADGGIRLMASDGVTVTYNLQKTGTRAPSDWAESWKDGEIKEKAEGSRIYTKEYPDGIVTKPPKDPGSSRYTFLHWSASPDDSSGDFFKEGNTVTIEDFSITLYAIWTLKEKTIIINLHGGTFSNELVDSELRKMVTGSGVEIKSVVAKDDTYTITWTANNERGECKLSEPSILPQKEGYDFVHWYNTSTGKGEITNFFEHESENLSSFTSSTKTIQALYVPKGDTAEFVKVTYTFFGDLVMKDDSPHTEYYTVSKNAPHAIMKNEPNYYYSSSGDKVEHGYDYTFLGWYTKEPIDGIAQGQKVDEISLEYCKKSKESKEEGITHTLDLYAVWQAEGKVRYALGDKDSDKGEEPQRKTGFTWNECGEYVIPDPDKGPGNYIDTRFFMGHHNDPKESEKYFIGEMLISIPNVAPIRPGYEFFKWRWDKKEKKEDGEEVLDPQYYIIGDTQPFGYSGERPGKAGEKINYETLKAEWSELTTTISYQVDNAIRGTVSESADTMVGVVTGKKVISGDGTKRSETTSDDAVKGSTATPKDGYKFKGWSVRGNDTIISKNETLDADTIQKYAQVATTDPNNHSVTVSGVTFWKATTFIANFEPDFSDVKAKGFEVVYDGKAHDGKIQVEGLLAGDIVAYYIKDTEEKLAEHAIAAEKTTDALNTERLKNVKDTGTSQEVEVKVTRAGVTHTLDIDAIIKPRVVHLRSESATKMYDGTPLTKHELAEEEKAAIIGDDDSGRGWIDGEGATYEFTGSQTVVGSSNNTYKVTAKEGTDLGNYTLYKAEGTLTVTPRPDEEKYHITVQANSGEKKYNGAEQSVTGFESLTFVLEDSGQTYTVEGLTASGNGVLAGVYDVLVSGTAIVRDANGNDVTSQFVVEPKPGKLTITDDAAPELVVAKTHEGKDFKAGDVVAFTVSATNIYDEEKDITLTEQEGVTFEAGTSGASVSGNGKSATFAKVPKGGKVTITAKYTVTAEDVQKGSYTNTVTAKFSGSNRTFTGSDTLNTAPTQTEADPPSAPTQTEADPPSTPSQTEAEQLGTPSQTETDPPSTPSQTETEQPGAPAQTEAGQPDTTPQTETEKAKTGAKLTVTKSIVNESDRHLIGLDGATFYVALFSDAKLTQLASDIRELDFDLDTAVASVTYKNLKPGTYYVSEVNAKGKAVKSGQYGGGAYAAKYADDVQKVTIAKGDRAVEFAFENWFLELPDEQYYKDLGLPKSKTESEPETEAGTEPETQADGTVPGDTTAAKTGDGTPIGRMLLLLAVSGALLILTEKRRRRSRM